MTEVTAKGKAEKHSVLWAFRYMSETKHAELLKLIPQIVPLVEHMPLRLDLENIHAKWLEAEALSMEAQSVQPWVAVVNRSRNVIHIHRKGDKDEHNVPRVKTLPLTDIPVDIAGKLQVLSMLKAGDTVEGVGCKLSENQYSFILPTVEE